VDGETVGPRHIHVEQDTALVERFGRGDKLHSGSIFADFVSACGEKPCQSSADGRIVVDKMH
jgi:hypothetical protein